MSGTKFDFKGEIKELAKNKNFFWISVCFMLMYGFYTTIGAIINTMVNPYGYTASDSGIFGACFIFSGLVGSFIQGALLDKYGKYLLLLKGICFGVLFFFLGFFYTLRERGDDNTNMIVLTFNVAIIGFLLLPIIPLGYGFSIELTYPVSEAMSNGVLMLWSQMAGSLLTFVGSWLCEQNPRYILYMFFVQVSLGYLASCMITEDLRRVNLTKNKNQKILPGSEYMELPQKEFKEKLHEDAEQ